MTDWHTNTTRDLSGNGNTGSLALMSTSSSPTIGKIGQALNFNGATNKISITSSSAISWSAGQKFSVSAWIKVASHDGTNREIVRKGDGGDGTGWFLLLNQANNIAFTSSGTAPEYTGGSPYPADNNWHMVTGTFDGSRIDVYLDGKNVANYAGSGPDTNTDQLMLGVYSGGVQYLLGGLDEVRIYNRALSATEVKQLYNLGTAKIGHSNIAISNGLVGYWPLDGNTTNWATGKTSDISGNGNDGSLGAMSTSSSPIIGRIGEAFNFDGTSQYIPTSVNTTVTSATFSAWIKMTTTPGFSGIVYSRGTTVTGIGFGLDYTLSYTWNNDPSTWGWYTGLVVPIGRWVFVAVAVQPTYATAYLYDPTSGLQSAVNVTVHSATTIDDLLIGRDEFDVRYFPGLIDDVRLYNRALSTTEIKQLYNLGVAKIGHSNVAISNGLVGYWTFDGGSIDWRTNTVRDMSGNGNDGSLGAMSTTTSPVIGKIGSAMSFDGTNQQIRVGTVGGYSNNISVSAWFYHRALTGGYDEIIGADDCNNFIIYFDSSYINWSLQCGPGILIPNIYDNGWHHIVTTNNGTNAFIYIDGKVVGSGSGLTPFTPGALAIGGNGVNEDGDFNGKIDDVRIYNRVLSATEVQQLYNAER